MSAWASVLSSVAASAVFFFIEPQLLALKEPWRLIGTAAVFVASAALMFYFQRRVPPQKQTNGFLSDNEIGKSLTARLDGTELSSAPTSKVLSGNKIGGNADVNITDSKF